MYFQTNFGHHLLHQPTPRERIVMQYHVVVKMFRRNNCTCNSVCNFRSLIKDNFCQSIYLVTTVRDVQVEAFYIPLYR